MSGYQPTHSALDGLVHAHARVKFLAAWVSQHDPDGQHELSRHLGKLERAIGEDVRLFGAGDVTHYSTGLPVWSLEKPAADTDFAWVWHPDPGHESNRPRVIDGDADLGNGERGAIVISAPGVIDVVRHNV